ncbi:hypothetical protein G9Q86_21930 [Pseudomonas sp. CCUG 57209]|uniref:hypothetical protein n=1 Tax=Pseudomonas sivasensis TaxID=1880678 RepID=UPI0015EB7DF4|nr:hypothetical protein [Pseudomonas sivasensis]MBA2931220.1 hypothetical protein [Pseudomonas sivasensis]
MNAALKICQEHFDAKLPPEVSDANPEPDRLKQKQAQTKDHWTKVEERYLTRAFKDPY